MQTVLLADDTDAVRQVCCKLLREYGYAVLEACDGFDALSMARRYREPIDLLITDLVMPRLGGLELSRALKDIHPETSVLFISGHYADELDSGVAFLAKPFTAQALLDRVGGLLANRLAVLGKDAAHHSCEAGK